VKRKVRSVQGSEQIHFDSLEIRFRDAIGRDIQVLCIVNSRIRRNCQLASGPTPDTKINSTKLVLCLFKESDIFLPFRDICFDKDGIPLPKFGHDRFPLRGIHIYNCEFPSLLCEIRRKRETDTFSPVNLGSGGPGELPDAPPVTIPTLSGISSSSCSYSKADIVSQAMAVVRPTGPHVGADLLGLTTTTDNRVTNLNINHGQSPMPFRVL
jgi:hypothetical protein